MNENKTSIDMRRTGLKLQRLARLNGYSVKDIQKYLLLSCPQPVYRWYKGSILPSVDNLLRLSELFHVHMEELLVKEYSDNMLDRFTSIENDGLAFYKRMKAYYILFAA
ncbi:hypothetical protein SAMN05216349_103174 [Oribacterium sp. KHPX15]|uniref:helix-turn-helix domain-containing protein n=1 Tax=Oribacterium sp. KHPX15 TaxID=1855342 RepID=UPI00089581D2|nr:helix-turn-helix transcriptional regulator [Oribacterium sp. KHPX15]SEA00136.1 hypothetical protein SAMN05216349_103174 [Oribacterium sp. KHPX15]